MKRIIFILLVFFIFTGYSHAGDVGDIDIHGFISQGFLKTTEYNFLANDSEQGTFQFNELGLNFSTNVMEDLRIGAQFFARDLGALGNDQVMIDWAFADYRWQDWLGIRAGILKVPVGLYNETRDIDLLRTSIFLPSGVYLEQFRDAYSAHKGVGIYGSFDLSVLGFFRYQAQYGTATPSTEGGMADNYENDFRKYGVYDPVFLDFEITGFNMKDVYTVAFRWLTPLDGLRLGYTRQGWDFTTDGVMAGGMVPLLLGVFDLAQQVGSVEFTWNDLIITAEYWNVWFDTSMEIAGAPQPSSPKELDGYYGMVTYRFTDWFEAGAYYSVTYPDAEDREGESMMLVYDYEAWLKDMALSLRFDINAAWTLKLEGHKMNGVAYVMDADNRADWPDGYTEKDWYMFATKLSYNF